MLTCTRRFEWDSMHRIPGHEGQCSAFHGHRYTAEIKCGAPKLDECGRLIDFGIIKAKIGNWIDHNWDHTAILMRDDPDPAVPALAKSNEQHGKPVYWLITPPTAENLVAELSRVCSTLLGDSGVEIVAIRLWETPNCSAEWRPDIESTRDI